MINIFKVLNKLLQISHHIIEIIKQGKLKPEILEIVQYILNFRAKKTNLLGFFKSLA